MALEKEKQREEIEEKLFHLENKYIVGERPKKTIVQPFQISKGNHFKHREIRKEINSKNEEECTFHPRTNYQFSLSPNSEQIK